LGGALVTAQTIITESYPIAKEGWQSHLRNGVIVGPTLGPPLEAILWIAFLGLIFLHQYSFRYHRNPLTLSFVRSPKYGEKLKSNQVDWLGIILLASFIGSLQFVLEHGQQDDWFNNKLIVLLSAVSIWSNTIHLASVDL
jgi:DHA2 family multidrug resistance protein